MQYLSKDQIINATVKSFEAFTAACATADEALCFERPSAEKWSVAENIQHLIVSTNTSKLAFTLPAFLVRWIGGTPNRDSKSYEALVDKYKEKLAAGGRASGRFIPKPMDIKCSKEKLLQNWQNAAGKFIAAIKNNSSESKLDDYLVRHPLLGRITLRELCYFTIYHTEHHLNIIEGILIPPPLNS
jgi:hypothetical protein